MRLRRSCLLSLSLLLVACQVSVPPAPKGNRGPGSGNAPASASSRPDARATATPRASTAPNPARTPAPPVLLAPPTADSVKLTGTLRVDPAYLVAAGAGNILSHNGAQIVAAGGLNMVAAGAGNLVAAGAGNLVAAGAGNIVAAGAGNVVAVTGSQIVAAGGLNMVAAGGGNIVAAGGLNMVAAGAGNLVGPDGASLVGPDGASLVGPDGASLIGPDGASLVGPGGASLIGPGGASLIGPGSASLTRPRAAGYGLAQASAPARELPAAGMLVSVVSLATRRYLPLGRTPDGKDDVYAVYSNAEGKFEVGVPKGEEGNVMVVASLPGQRAAGTIYNAITQPTEALVVDEDAATVTRYLRRALVGRLAEVLVAPDVEAGNKLLTFNSAIDPLAKEQLRAVLVRMRELAATVEGFERSAGDPALHAAQARVIAQAIVDATFSRVDLRELRINPVIVPGWKDASRRLDLPGDDAGRVLPLLQRCFSVLRTRTEAAMPLQPDGTYKPLAPTFFQRVAVGSDPWDWIAEDRGMVDWFDEVIGRYGAEPYAIGKPALLGDFLVEQYLGLNRPFSIEPVLTAFMLLDPATYPASQSRWDGLSEPELARASAILARINARFPALALSAADPNFSVARRLGSTPYAYTLDAIGFTMFVEVGVPMLSADSAVARAVAAALKNLALPPAAPPAGG